MMSGDEMRLEVVVGAAYIAATTAVSALGASTLF